MYIVIGTHMSHTDMLIGCNYLGTESHIISNKQFLFQLTWSTVKVHFCLHFTYVFVSTCSLLLTFHILIISFETTGPIRTKLCRNDVCFWLSATWTTFSESTDPNELLHNTNDVCEVLYKQYSFILILVKNIEAMGISCVWFAEAMKKNLCQINNKFRLFVN